MTRTEARIVVRMLGVLVIGLSIRPMFASVLALPSLVRWMIPSAAASRSSPPWQSVAGFFFAAAFYVLCVLLGVYLMRRAETVTPRLFPEAQT